MALRWREWTPVGFLVQWVTGDRPPAGHAQRHVDGSPWLCALGGSRTPGMWLACGVILSRKWAFTPWRGWNSPGLPRKAREVKGAERRVQGPPDANGNFQLEPGKQGEPRWRGAWHPIPTQPPVPCLEFSRCSARWKKELQHHVPAEAHQDILVWVPLGPGLAHHQSPVTSHYNDLISSLLPS